MLLTALTFLATIVVLYVGAKLVKRLFMMIDYGFRKMDGKFEKK